MMCARKGWSVDARDLPMLRSSRARVRQKRSRLRRNVSQDAFPLDFAGILKLNPPAINYTVSPAKQWLRQGNAAQGIPAARRPKQNRGFCYESPATRKLDCVRNAELN